MLISPARSHATCLARLQCRTSCRSKFVRREVQVHVAFRLLRLADMLEKQVLKSTVQYMYLWRTAQWFTSPPFPYQPSPCIRISLLPDLSSFSLQPQPCTSAPLPAR